MLWLLPSPLAAQQLLDRVVARVDGSAITLTDVRAAVALGVLDLPPEAGEDAAAERLIDRQLVLVEVARFTPPEPPPADVAREAAAMTARVGEGVAALMQRTGLDEGRVREIARDTLRIQAYLNQRYGTASQLTEDEVLQYYRIHPEDFTRENRLAPFAEAEPLARRRAAAERRAAAVAQLLRDLRGRAEIVMSRRSAVGGRQ
ncbi:MAG: hypothetical protein HY824_12890 [Acidobacteria bacterium]|nr:hypothetical protein [Acidobacteriota bacterium]